MEEQLLATLPANSCNDVFIEGMERQLGKKEFAYQLLVNQAASGSVKKAVRKPAKKLLNKALKIHIDQCGFKLVNQETGDIAAFISLRYYDHRDSKVKKQSLYVAGKKRAPFSAWEEDLELCQHELEATLRKAGKRLANKLIYRRSNI